MSTRRTPPGKTKAPVVAAVNKTLENLKAMIERPKKCKVLALVLDTETTGTDPEVDAVVELGGTIVNVDAMSITGSFGRLVNPGRPIPPEAMGIHHIMDHEVVNAPLLKSVIDELRPLAPFVPVAHSAHFDSQFLPVFKNRWVCTYRCARHVWPDAPGFSNQTLRYWLPGVNDECSMFAMPPHRAKPDSWVTAHILLRLLREKTIEELVRLTDEPILLKKVTFGKHRGEEWSKVPLDYLSWVKRQPDMDADVKHTAIHYLQNR